MNIYPLSHKKINFFNVWRIIYEFWDLNLGNGGFVASFLTNWARQIYVNIL
jgi:hypothetical protein